jgi:hypothetical protein
MNWITPEYYTMIDMIESNVILIANKGLKKMIQLFYSLVITASCDPGARVTSLLLGDDCIIWSMC